MENRNITPEMARQELQRRQAARNELARRKSFLANPQSQNSFMDELSKIPGYTIESAIGLPGRIADTAKQLPGASEKLLQHPIEAMQDLSGGLARGSQNLASSLLEGGEYLTRKGAEGIGNILGNPIKVPKWNAREFMGLEGNNRIDLGKYLESKNPNALLSGIGQYGLGAASGGTRFLPMATANALNAAIQASPGNRLQSAVEGASNIAIPVAAGKLAGKSYNLASPTIRAQNKLLGDVKSEEVSPRVEAAERLGLSYITPAEASGNPLIAATEGRVGRTPEGARMLLNRSNERLESERKAIDNLLNTIGNPETLEKAQQLYTQSHTSSASPQFVQKLLESPIIAQAFKKVQKDPIYKQELNEVPEHNFKYLDRVKQTLDDMYSSEERAGNNNKARLIAQQTKKLTKEMDKIDPVYAQAREYSQRNILRNKIEEGIANEKIRGSDFYRKFLSNAHTYNKLYNSLKNVPEAQQQLKDMRLAFENLVNPVSVRTAKGMSKTSTSMNRNMKDVAIDWLHKLEGGHSDLAAVNLMTNPKWIEQVK